MPPASTAVGAALPGAGPQAGGSTGWPPRPCHRLSPFRAARDRPSSPLDPHLLPCVRRGWDVAMPLAQLGGPVQQAGWAHWGS